MSKKYWDLKTRNDGIRREIKIIQKNIVLAYEEIEMRNRVIKSWMADIEKLNNDAQEIADEMLKLEYETLKANNI